MPKAWPSNASHTKPSICVIALTAPLPASSRRPHRSPASPGHCSALPLRPEQSELRYRAPATHPPSLAAAMNAPGSDGGRAGAQTRPRSSRTTSSPQQSAASPPSSIAAVAQDLPAPSQSSCVHLNLPVNVRTIACIHAQVQAGLAGRLPVGRGPSSCSKSAEGHNKRRDVNSISNRAPCWTRPNAHCGCSRQHNP
jgi:hypothetical protein